MNEEGKVFQRFINLVSRLRKDCPWDREQTIKSMMPNIVEESQEVVHASEVSHDHLEEELGDLVLVISMIAEIAREKGKFDMKSIIDKITEKVIFRHPHIFSDVKANSVEEVRDIWNERKKIEKRKKVNTYREAISVQKSASELGFDWDDSEGVIEKLHEEIDEFLKAENEDEKESEFGDILFAVLHLANHSNIDPEKALSKTLDKFNRRFEYVKEEMKKKGYNMEHDNLNIMEEFWRKKAGGEKS